ncbi:D-xylose ABC transporter ATP-binding protein [Polaribacter reichenbachii]|uniref:D-ribose transporter ATP-binding protein n=1 Tax=Polaribacter reichenbachii TaxID=996801 RepID=A0A1B8TNP8_9FLAO|nr:sugar ABC transporter ATP-binding protein [Polaribacter reichenbachii]APZ46675.1 D-xylose ABC transporter ATP-binding protein [Polaribacter reichenbachii]AUC17318.1 D-xylose ABC transporter ATP-binding protein [Polaribacter reichenbachii]OBY61233.1 D-ribose transporter ATP-binding protein [Polaribacter reichenbachii]
MSALLEVKNINKKFSGVTALNKINLQLFKGKVTALIGENGAGKSTLLKIMSGIYTDFEGDILFKEKPVKFSKPKDAQDIGISIIHQELNLIPYLTVTQNIFLGREMVNKLGFLEASKMHQKTKELLENLKLNAAPEALISSLKVGQQQIVEIAKALLIESEVVFMDEPTSAIGENEVETLFEIINQLKSEGKAIVYISHKLDELDVIADNFIVLRDGNLAGKGEMNSISRDQLINMMAGREVKVKKKEARPISKDVLLEITNLKLNNPNNPGRPLFQNINLKLYKGEILGIYGLMGSGRTELCESIFGLNHKLLEGTIALEGKYTQFKSPIQAINSGIALVPEDRKSDGIVPGLSVSKNLSLTVLDKIIKYGILNKSLQTKLYDKHKEALKIKVNSEAQLIKNLSGGNQQKVILGKWIERNPKVLILDEPTRGIDINAKNEIYELVAKLADSGISILVISSEIPEILAIADRVLVMADGEISAEFTSQEATENSIMNACIPENVNL